MPRRPHRRHLATLLAMVLLSGVAVGLPLEGHPAGAAATLPTVGMVTDLTWGISRSDMDRTVQLLVASGVRSVRLNVSWSGVERDGKGVLNMGWLAEIDAAVGKARRAGLEVLMPIGDGVPYWASADRAKSGGVWNERWRPTRMADYADFVRFVVSRYSPLGVAHYEIWNEPNLPHSWPSGVSAAAYTEMLRAGSAAVRQANPAAKVVLGGLSKSDSTYMLALYAAGAGPLFDIAAIHPYTGDIDPAKCWTDSTGRKAKEAFCGIEAVRDVMVANGDAAKPLWLTELGWSTTTGAYGVSEAQQARYLSVAYTWLSSRPYVTHAFWYGFRNTHWLRDDPAQFDANTGVLRTDFTPKLAYHALRAIASTATGVTRSGYWMVTGSGQVFAFGGVRSHGDRPGAEDLEPTPSGEGYWLVDATGGVHAFGDAVDRGEVARGTLGPDERITSLSATPSGGGYWLFSSRGRVLPFGDAGSHGDALGVRLTAPVVDSVRTPSGGGYYMLGSDGGIFTYGDARFSGSMGARRVDAPVRALVPDPDGSGYWLVASDGGVFAFAAGFWGSLGGTPLNRPISGAVGFGHGYLMVAEDGGIFNFSERPFFGSLGANPPDSPVVAVASVG